jgi:hypothetical protein
MLLRFLYLFTISILLGTPGLSQINSWRGLTPLVSKRADVEKLLGKPSAELRGGYVIDQTFIRPDYVEGRCKNGWNVDSDTLFSIEVTPEDLLNKSFQELGLDKIKFSRTTDDALYTRYTDIESGVSFYFSNYNQYLISKTLIPKKSDYQKRCNGFPPYNPGGYHFHVDEFALYKTSVSRLENISDAIARFDSVFFRLGDSGMKEFNGFAIVYFDKRRSFKWHSNYLAEFKRSLQISAGRSYIKKVRIIEGGLREQSAIMLYVLHSSQIPPVPQPDFPSPQFMKR